MFQGHFSHAGGKKSEIFGKKYVSRILKIRLSELKELELTTKRQNVGIVGTPEFIAPEI